MRSTNTIKGLLGAIAAILIAIGGFVWNLSATLTSIRDNEAQQLERVDRLEKEVERIESVFYVPRIGGKDVR